MGSPQNPTADQIRLMEAASQLTPLPAPGEVTSTNGQCEIKFPLPRQGVTLVELVWP